VVTGASAGIGKAAARGLAALGARVVLAVRSREKGEAVRREITAASGNEDLELLVADLQSQASIRRASAELVERHPALHVLVNNAGVWLDRRHESPDGIETTWATNVLGYHLFTHCLLPALEKGAPARVVNVASEFASDLDLDDVELERRPYLGRLAYAQSKQADRMWTWALAKRLEGKGVTANALHPGFVATELFAKSGGLVGRAISLYAGLGALAPEEGADTAVFLAASPEVEGISGRFFAGRRERPCRFRGDPREDALFGLCQRMTGTA
jgi:NAD(P)-dependent dehydrogenase (short-subunit alcohol dehydrogenase family)